VTAVSKPANGTVTVNTDGTITYSPAGGFTGVDTFTYTVSDGKGSTATATVAVAVGVTNGPPVLANDPANSSQTVQVGQTLQPLTATDPDGDTYSFVVSAGALPPGVTLNPDGTFTGTPTSTGIFSATITVCDSNGLCSSGVLSLQVVAPGELPFTGVESNILAFTGLLMTLLGAALVAASRRRREQGL
jgi:LPXTG-motif cell wall-anchored protein